MKKIIITLVLLCSLPCYAKLNTELPINAKSAPLIAKMMESEDLSDSNFNDDNLIIKKITFENNTLTFEYALRPVQQVFSEDELIQLFDINQQTKQQEICADERNNQLNQYMHIKHVYHMPTKPKIEINIPIQTCQASNMKPFDLEKEMFTVLKQTTTKINSTLPKKIDEIITLTKAELDETQKMVIYYYQIDLPKEKFTSPEFKELQQMGHEYFTCNNEGSSLFNEFIHLKYIYTSPHAPKHQFVITVPQKFCINNMPNQ